MDILLQKHRILLITIIFSAASIVTPNEGIGKLIEGNQQIGWMELKGYIHHILDIIPLKVIYVFDPYACSAHCMLLEGCISTNVIYSCTGICACDTNLTCQLLNGDKFRNKTDFQSKNYCVHYAIKV